MAESEVRPEGIRAEFLLPYLFGFTAVVAATMMALMARPVFGAVQPYIVYILPVMAAAAYGGLRPGLAAAAFSTLGIIFVFLHGSLDISSDLFLLLFLLDGLCISWLGEQMLAAIQLSRRAQRETQDAHRSQQRILSSISDAFGALDRECRFIYANRNFASMAGKAPEELTGKNVGEMVPAFSDGVPKKALLRALETGESTPFEMFVPLQNRWYETTVYPFDSGLTLCSRDITARRDAERVLRETEERLRLAPEVALVGTWTEDRQNGRLVCSPELEGMFGLTPAPFAATEEAFLERIHSDDRKAVREAFARCRADQVPFETEFRYSHPTGDARWMLIRGRGYSDDTGDLSRLVGIAIDVTVRKRNEERLRHTQRLESLGILAGGLAHDFNNLLLVIMGNANLASQLLPLHHPGRKPLEEIELASNKAANLTRQMLAYSGKGHVVTERLQIYTVIHDIERLIRSVIAKNVDLRLDLAAGLPEIEADAGQMQQVLMNLVINAAESIPEGRQGKVSVRAYARQGSVVIEVEDDGVGMDETTRARIFEPFFTTKFLGRGLGLAAVLGIIHAHQGSLQVESTPGKGSRFQVMLAAIPEAASARIPQPEAEVDLHGEGLVVVVDDEEPVRCLAGRILEMCGYTVLLAEDGFQAVKLVKECAEAAALVLLDLSMPGMSAQQTIEQLHFFRPDLPILLTSGYDESGMLAKFNSRFFGFIHKPYTPAQLSEKVKAGITEAAAARQAHALPAWPDNRLRVQ